MKTKVSSEIISCTPKTAHMILALKETTALFSQPNRDTVLNTQTIIRKTISLSFEPIATTQFSLL